jgi:hypothetical protein
MTEAPQGQGQAAPEAPAEGASQPPEGYVPQASVTKIAANEKREGKKARDSELLQQTGYESVEDMLKAATEYRNFQEQQKTEADKAAEKAERAEAARQAAEERYTTTLQTYALRDALRDRGVPSDRLDDALALAKRGKLEVDEDGNITGVGDVVEELLEPRPWLLEAQQETRPARLSPEATRQPVPIDVNSKENMGRGFLGWLTEPIPDDGGGFP